jgi:hypothetical protein
MAFSISTLIPFADTLQDVLGDKSGRSACEWLKKAYIANHAAGFCPVSEQTDLSQMCRELNETKLRIDIKSDIDRVLCLAIQSDRSYNFGQYVDTAWSHMLAFPERFDDMRFNVGDCMKKVSVNSLGDRAHRIAFSILMERKGSHMGNEKAKAILEAIHNGGFDESSLGSLRQLIQVGGNDVHTKIRAKHHNMLSLGSIKFSTITKGHLDLLNMLMPTQAMILQFASDLFQKQLGKLFKYTSHMDILPCLSDESEIDAVFDLIELSSTCLNENSVLYAFNTVMNRELDPKNDNVRSAECEIYLSERLKKIFARMDGISSIWRLSLIAHLSPVRYNEESESMESIEFNSCLEAIALALAQTKESNHLERLVCQLLISEYDYQEVIETLKDAGNSLAEIYKLNGDKNLIKEMNGSQRRVAINSDLGL